MVLQVFRLVKNGAIILMSHHLSTNYIYLLSPANETNQSTRIHLTNYLKQAKAKKNLYLIIGLKFLRQSLAGLKHKQKLIKSKLFYII